MNVNNPNTPPPGIATPEFSPDFPEPDDIDLSGTPAAPRNGHQNGAHVVEETPSDEDAPDALTPDNYRLSHVAFEKDTEGDGSHKVVGRTETVREYHARVSAPGTPLARKTAAIRRLLGPNGKKTSAFDTAKGKQSMVMPAVNAPPGTLVAGMHKSATSTGSWHSGIYGYDVDKGEADWAALRTELIAMPSALMVATSSSGGPLYALIAGTPATTPEDYTAKWHQGASLFPKNILVTTSTESHELNRMRYTCHDANAWLAESVIPMDLDASAEDTPAEASQGDPDSETPRKAGRSRTPKKKGNADLARDKALLPGALAFLAEKKAGENDSIFQAVGNCLHAMGHSFQEFDNWAAAAGCTCPNREKRWLSFDKADDKTYGAIIGTAVKMGWKTDLLSDWYEVGNWLGSALKTLHRYDPEREEWWRWKSGCWLQEGDHLPRSIEDYLRKNRAQLDARLAEKSATFEGKDGEPVRKLLLTEKNLNIHKGLGILSGIRNACARAFPNYESDQPAKDIRARSLAVPSGVVDLITGRMVRHDPLVHDTRAITTGDYRPADAAHLGRVLRDRFRLVLDDAEYETFLAYLGMTVSGEGQSFRSIVLCLGGEGTGKGGLGDLIGAAWGRRAATLPMNMLERSTQEIDSTRYAIMRDQPLFLLLDESGNINTSTLNHIAGKNRLAAARLPYMKFAYADTIPSVIWWTTVETPALKRKTGVDRRMGFLPFVRKIADADKDARQFFDKDLLDAMVTVGILQAIRWLRREICDPGIDPPSDVLADMDGVQDALCNLDPGKWEGMSVDSARSYITALTGDKSINVTSFGNAVNLNSVWFKKRATTGEFRNQQVLCLRPVSADAAPVSQYVYVPSENLILDDEPGWDDGQEAF